MGKHSQVQFALDKEIESRSFERLAIDLLGREGFTGIVPGGGHRDHGRDAEIRFWEGQRELNIRVVFQFSLEQAWEKKLLRDAAKIAIHSPETRTFVFVTTRAVTGEKQDKLSAEFKKARGWNLCIYDGEWLRYQLEEVHQDLASKYLGIDLPDTPPHAEMQIDLYGLNDESAPRIFRKIPPETVRAALIERTRKQSQNWRAWKKLADVEFYLHNHDDALRAVTTALAIMPNDWNLILRKATVLAEMGIEKQSRSLLVQAKEIFVHVARKLSRAVDHYNLANVLGPLGERELAEKHYRLALAKEPNDPRIWKNLGSLLFHKGDHVAEMECYNKALALNPNLVEAHLSKATTYIMALKNPTEALRCFEKAYTIDPNLDRKWRHARYWYSEALARLQRLEEALTQIDIGLVATPDDKYLLKQKAAVLLFLWPSLPKYEGIALKFYKFRAAARRNDFHSLFQIVQILMKQGTPNAAWPIIEASLDASPFSFRQIVDGARLSMNDLAKAFQESRAYIRFREGYPVTDYFISMRQYGLNPRPEMQNALVLSLMAPFGVFLQELRAIAKKPASEAVLAAFDRALAINATIMANFGSSWIGTDRPQTVEVLSDALARAVCYLPDVVVAETSRQFGFCLGILRVPQESIPDAGNRDWAKLRTNIARLTIEAMPEDWLAFPAK